MPNSPSVSRAQLQCESRTRAILVARMRPRIAYLVLALGLVGCKGDTEPPVAASPLPLAPVNTPAVSVLADATLSVVVYEVTSESSRQLVGIEGVAVYCEQCGESTHNYAQTNSKGDYVFPRGIWTEGRPAFPIRIWVGKEGYG